MERSVSNRPATLEPASPADARLRGASGRDGPSRSSDRPAKPGASRRSATTTGTPARRLGAVLGSKNLKAIAVRGTTRTRSRPAGVVAAAKDLSAIVRPGDGKYRELRDRRQSPHLQSPECAADAELPGRAIRGRGSHLGRVTERGASRYACRMRCTIGCEHIYQLSGTGDRRLGQA